MSKFHISLAAVAAATLLIGTIVTVPVAASPVTDPRPLVEYPDEEVRSGGFTISQDKSELFIFGADGDGAVYDTNTREKIGSFAQNGLGYYGRYMQTSAPGPQIAMAEPGGYWTLDLTTRAATLHQIQPEPGESVPNLVFATSHADRSVTGITEDGLWIKLDSGTVTDSKRVYPENMWPYISQLSSNGGRYVFGYEDWAAPGELGLGVVDMISGELVLDTVLHDDEILESIVFDSSNGSLWGLDWDNDSLVNLSVPGGTVQKTIPLVDPYFNSLLRVDSAKDWFLADDGGMLAGGILSKGEFGGAREVQCCTHTVDQIGTDGDIVFFDIEMLTTGIIASPRTTHPEDVTITALGDAADFTAEADGLALSEFEEGNGFGYPFGSVWQSSVDGTTWTDLSGEEAATLGLTASAENYPPEYRRHYLDGFWGARLSSESARMRGPAPVITREDDLPDGQAGEDYPAQEITATGQSDLRWSVSGLPAELRMDPATGIITGIPSEAGDYSFDVTVTDLFGTDTKTFHLTVSTVTVPTSSPSPSEPEPSPSEPGPTSSAPGSSGGPQPSKEPGDPGDLAGTGFPGGPGILVGAGLLLGLGMLLARRNRAHTF